MSYPRIEVFRSSPAVSWLKEDDSENRTSSVEVLSGRFLIILSDLIPEVLFSFGEHSKAFRSP
jgi:hypothetical protein